MFGSFFGDFLLKEGVITREHLDAAVAVQRQQNALFGYLAKSHGWLDESTLSRLLTVQSEQHEKLGTIAVDAGLLSSAQVEALLAEQARNHLFLGDALVRMGILNPKSLDHYLQMFHTESEKVSESMKAQIHQLAYKDLVNAMLEAYRAFFFRLGYVVKISRISSEAFQQAPGSVLFLSSFRFRHGRIVYMGPVLSEEAVTFLRSGGGLFADVAFDTKRDAIEYIEQLIYGLHYQSCRETGHGIERPHVGAIHATVPFARSATIFTLIGLTAPFQIVYFD